ncbi:MAG: hypothetical protein HY017_27220 [Betaproteobacteria bacterium]|nr:hypothetical protein [Betaproteobacteria bacterium]
MTIDQLVKLAQGALACPFANIGNCPFETCVGAASVFLRAAISGNAAGHAYDGQ